MKFQVLMEDDVTKLYGMSLQVMFVNIHDMIERQRQPHHVNVFGRCIFIKHLSASNTHTYVATYTLSKKVYRRKEKGARRTGQNITDVGSMRYIHTFSSSFKISEQSKTSASRHVRHNNNNLQMHGFVQ